MPALDKITPEFQTFLLKKQTKQKFAENSKATKSNMEVLKDKTTVLLILWLALTSEFNGKCRNIQGFATGGCSMRVDEPGALAEIKQQLHFLCRIPFIKTPL